MSQKLDALSSQTPGAFNYPHGQYPALDYMKANRIPISREQFIALNWPVKPLVWTVEDEQELPPELRQPVVPDNRDVNPLNSHEKARFLRKGSTSK